MKNFYFSILFLFVSCVVSAQISEDLGINETTIINRIGSSTENTNNISKSIESSQAISTVTNVTGTSAEVGVTGGQLSVSLNGNASYTIPISVPKGINGVEPQ
ncbi:MAG: hypothetical protein WAM46_20245, partial [Flavobacterium sp.]